MSTSVNARDNDFYKRVLHELLRPHDIRDDWAPSTPGWAVVYWNMFYTFNYPPSSEEEADERAEDERWLDGIHNTFDQLQACFSGDLKWFLAPYTSSRKETFWGLAVEVRATEADGTLTPALRAAIDAYDCQTRLAELGQW